MLLYPDRVKVPIGKYSSAFTGNPSTDLSPEPQSRTRQGMEPPRWQPISGTPPAEVYGYLRKPQVFSSNSYLVRTDRSIAVIDPGGLPEQTEALVSLVKDLLREKPRPVYVLLTHCHSDHSLEITRDGPWRELDGLKVAIHAAGAAALRTADRRATHAEILGLDPAPFSPDISLFLPPPEPVPAGGTLPVESIPLNPPDAIAAYAVPGHSPDCVCYRFGSTLFIGDVLAAISPLIAGAPGWNRDDLVASVKGLIRLLETDDIRTCFPGHGRPLSGKEAASALKQNLEEALALPEIETADSGRVKYISGYARELFEELGDAFMLIHRRIEDLAGRLHHLEEPAAAEEIARILDSEQVSRLLLDFRNFQEGFRAGEVIEVEIAHKSIQLIRRIALLLAAGGLDRVLDPSLLRLTRTLLDDFINAARGLRPAEEKTDADLNELAATLAALMQRVAGAGRSLEDIPDDPDGFRDYLVSSLALVPVFRGVKIEVKPETAAAPVRVARDRFLDGLKRLLEDLAEEGAAAVGFTVEAGESGPALLVRVEFARPIYRLGDGRLRPHRRRLDLSGSRTAVRYSSRALDFTLQF